MGKVRLLGKRMPMVLLVISIYVLSACGTPAKLLQDTPVGGATEPAADQASVALQGTPPASQTGSPGEIVHVIEKDFAIILDKDVALPGQVTFQMTNQGPASHSLAVIKTDLAPASLPEQAGQVVVNGPGEQEVGFQPAYPPGESRTLTINMQPGNYVLVCTVPGHYQVGMYAGFVVTSSAGPTLTAEAKTGLASPTPTSMPSATPQSGTPSPTTKIRVIEETGAILMSTCMVPSGKVEFDLTNIGITEANFILLRTDIAPGSLPVQGAMVDVQASGVTQVAGEAAFPPNETRTLTVDLQPGKYVAISNLEGQYGQGMYFGFTVVSPTATPAPTMAGQGTLTATMTGQGSPTPTTGQGTPTLTLTPTTGQGTPTLTLTPTTGRGTPTLALTPTGPGATTAPGTMQSPTLTGIPLGQPTPTPTPTLPGAGIVPPTGMSAPTATPSPTPTPIASNTPTPPPQPSTTPTIRVVISVSETDNSILMGRATALAGTLLFHVVNDGPSQHDFTVIKTDLPPNNLPVQNQQVNVNVSGVQLIAQTGPIPANTAGSLVVTLLPGQYVLLSNLPGDYQAGIWAGFTVTAP